MSKPVSPYAIGVFLVGSVMLLVAAILIFGGGQFLTKKTEYVIYFDSALNGLNVGAPVTLQGVQIGKVKEIALQLDPKTLHLIQPVVIEIDQDRVLDSAGQAFQGTADLEKNQINTQRLIDAGLKAQLKTQSLLTGLLYVEFDFHHDNPLKLTGSHYKGLIELPSVPTTEDQIRNTADEILTKLRELPIEQIIKDLADTLKAVRDIATSEELQKNRAALSRTLDETAKLVATMNQNLAPLLTNMNSTVGDTRTLVRQFTQDIKPVLLATEKTLDTANSVLLQSKQSLGSVEAMTDPDAPLSQALQAVQKAAQSTKHLTDYLQRHPESLLYGKDQ
jgi:paraquat-inducible protein B